MLKLFNLSTHEMDLKKFDQNPAVLESFLARHRLDGIELIQGPGWSEEILPSSMVKGLHMRYWPIWLDFWKGDKETLLEKFGDAETIRQFYGGESREAMVRYYRNELDVADRIGVEYVVFHVANVEPEHCFSYQFSYKSEAVVEAAIELLNEVFAGKTCNFDLLFENLWWPGLTLLDRHMVCRLMEGVLYPHKGLMLDTSHLMNNNIDLAGEEEGVGYILQILESLGDAAAYIKGIHLNSSLSGEYVKKHIGKEAPFKGGESFFDRYIEAYKHILNIDRHVPFENPSIRRVIDFVKPEYLVYEFLTDEPGKLEEYMDLQNRALGM